MYGAVEQLEGSTPVTSGDQSYLRRRLEELHSVTSQFSIFFSTLDVPDPEDLEPLQTLLLEILEAGFCSISLRLVSERGLDECPTPGFIVADSTTFWRKPQVATKTTFLTDLEYMTWNITYGVFHWGYPTGEEVQASLDKSIEQGIMDYYFPHRISVVGKETTAFSDLMQLEVTNPIPRSAASVLQVIGLMMIVGDFLLVLFFARKAKSRSHAEARIHEEINQLGTSEGLDHILEDSLQFIYNEMAKS